MLHAFFVPSMRVKRDVIPGRLQAVWFQPMELGDYHLFCAEYCGKDHSKMYAKVHVVSADKMKTRPWDVWDPKDPAKGGQNLYASICAVCHSINGTRQTGPTWKGLWGKDEDVIEGGERKRIKVDKAYVIESVRRPDAKKVVGYDGIMPAFSDRDIPEERLEGLIEYMKKLADTPAGTGEIK